MPGRRSLECRVLGKSVERFGEAGIMCLVAVRCLCQRQSVCLFPRHTLRRAEVPEVFIWKVLL